MENQITNPLRIQALFLMGFLAIQYLLGMYVNLFISFPDNANRGQLWEFAWSQPLLAAHIILAFLILVGAIVLCVRAVLRKERRWIIASVIGLISVFAAGVSGATFIPSQTNLYSYSMALWFLVALFAYAWGLYATRHV